MVFIHLAGDSPSTDLAKALQSGLATCQALQYVGILAKRYLVLLSASRGFSIESRRKRDRTFGPHILRNNNSNS